MAITQKDVVIIGGGPAGLAAAAELKKKGIRDIIIIEREPQLGGILRQCIHDGFGLTRFKEILSGPEYAQRFIDIIRDLHVEYITDTTVLDITPDKIVTAASPSGLLQYHAKVVILAMGCRERTRGAISIPGSRPAGIYNAGAAQSFINLHNTMIGKKAVILGSGDIGMIMARRLTLEGVKVKAVFEVMPYPSGLPRNIEQCLNDYGIPLYLSHTITDIKGRGRLESIVVAKVDDHMQPIAGTEKIYSCDTLILSVGLIPENELSLACGVTLDSRTKGAYVDENCQTNVLGVFAAGNVLQVHDLVDFVSMEAERLAYSVISYIHQGNLPSCKIAITTDSSIGYTVPQHISGSADVKLSFRVKRPMKDCEIHILQNGTVIKKKKLRNALPAQMIQIDLKATDIISTNEIKVVAL